MSSNRSKRSDRGKVSARSKRQKGNRWLKGGNRDGIDKDTLQLADDGSILYDSALEMLKGFQSFSKALGEDEKKHPYAKAAKACREYAKEMRNEKVSFEAGAGQLEGMMKTCHALKEHFGSSILSKLISFKDTECKIVDNQMTMFKKLHADYTKKKKANADKVILEAAESSFKKALEEAKDTLGKFTKAGTELMTSIAADAKTGFDAYCEQASNL
ncbi:unnamed protein product [Caenorhabditis sp. 36 PRJEB53466]|nr:unnamed protein product [Caenorhabditis sp. 36 PRJEB53466]